MALVFAHRHAASVSYFAPAEVTETSIDADLGSLGRIDVTFSPSGKSKRERSACDKRPVSVDSGRYEGTIDFEGEEGFAQAHADSARGDLSFLLSLVCSTNGIEGVGGRSPGARLTARHRGARHFGFEAFKNSPSRKATFSAFVEERRGSMTIERSLKVRAGHATFDYDVPAGTATVAPPAPFHGKAAFRRRSKGPPSWHGDLSVDFPGRAGVHLAGAGTRASIVRAVLNPSHPFRLR